MAKPNASKNSTPKEEAEILVSLKNNFELPIEDDYIYEQFGIEKPNSYDAMKASLREEKETIAILDAVTDNEPDKKDDNLKEGDESKKHKNKKSFINRLKSFFGLAPHKGGALEW